MMTKREPTSQQGGPKEDPLTQEEEDRRDDDNEGPDSEVPEVRWLGVPNASDPVRMKLQILGSAHGPRLLDQVSGPSRRRSTE